MTPRLLVIGGTGFIGYHLVKSTKLRGWDVTSISLHEPSPIRFVNGTNYVKIDISNERDLKSFLENNNFEYVVNLGGYIDHSLFNNGGRETIKIHFDALQTLVQYLNRDCLKRFIQIGSSDEYGNAPAPQNESYRELPISPYSFAKVAATHFLLMLNRTDNYPVVILRLFLTYGPGQDNKRFLPQIIDGCINNNSFPTSHGEQQRDFCYVSDTVDAIIKSLIKTNICGNIFNVGSGNFVTIREMINIVRKLVGSGTPQFGRIPYRPGENMELYANVSKIKKYLNWESKVSLELGLQETIDWYESKF